MPLVAAEGGQVCGASGVARPEADRVGAPGEKDGQRRPHPARSEDRDPLHGQASPASIPSAKTSVGSRNISLTVLYHFCEELFVFAVA